MRFGAVRCGELNIITGALQGHARNDGLVQIVSGRPPFAALDFDLGRIGSDDQHLRLAHGIALPFVLEFAAVAQVEHHCRGYT